MNPTHAAAMMEVLRGLPGVALIDDSWERTYSIVLNRIPDTVADSTMEAIILTCPRRPAPAEIMSIAWRLQYRLPTVGEAWGMVQTIPDDTIVWTTEIARAYEAAVRLIQAGDLTGARRAFTEVYDREIADSIAANRPPKWAVRLGRSTVGRKEVVEIAIAEGRIPDEWRERVMRADRALEAGFRHRRTEAQREEDRRVRRWAMGLIRARLEGRITQEQMTDAFSLDLSIDDLPQTEPKTPRRWSLGPIIDGFLASDDPFA